MIFDSHAHLDDKRFDDDRDNVIKMCIKDGITHIVNAGADMASSQRAVELADNNEIIYASVGIHPHDAKGVEDNYLDTLRLWAGHPKVVAIGEIGLDYYYDLSPRDVQRKRFIEQIKLAHDLNMPIIVHDRDAHGDTLDILKSHKAYLGAGVMHCFSGSLEMAMECMDLGFYISFAGPVTFANARKLADVAYSVPIGRILVETDSPYLTTQPHRGKRNYPGYVKLVIERIAGIKGMEFDEVAAVTAQNALDLFGIGRD